MKNLLYIGNQLSQKDKTATTIDTLSGLLRKEGYQVITASGQLNKLLRLLDMLWHIIKYRKGVHVVLIDTYSTQNFYFAYLCSQLCRALKLKYVPILHGGNLPTRLQQSPKLSAAIFNNAYKNIAPSGYLKSKFEALGYSNITVIPNSIPIANYPFKERLFKTPKLLWVRSFSKIYNPLLAIDILKALKDENFEATLCMIGPDNDGTLLQAKAHAKKLNVHVTFTGKLSKKAWIKRSAHYNIFINTTNFDNTPVSIIEAMALGLPVISTNVGGLPFLIRNKKDAILVNPNNVNEFVNEIKQIITHSNQAAQRVIKARQKAEYFDWQVVKHQWNNVLSK